MHLLHPHRTVAILLTSLLSMFVLSACQTVRIDLRSSCGTQFEKWDQEVDTAELALQPWVKSLSYPETESRVQERSPAAIVDVSVQPLNAIDQKAWSRWAIQRLNETQTLLQQVLQDRSKRIDARLLSKVADRVVFFHGSIETGDARRMMRELRRISEATRRARASICSISTAAI